MDARSTKSGVSFVRTPLKKVALLLVVLAVAGASVASTEARPTEPAPSPNLILVLTDNQGANTLPYMPHVGDEFKSKATTFPNATYNFPLCCPSRVSILCCQYTHNHNVWSNSAPDGGYNHAMALGIQDEQIARWLDSVGYQTGMFGKYINGLQSQGEPEAVRLGPLCFDRVQP